MSTPSTLNAQQLLDYGRLFKWTTPVLGVAGYSQEPAVSFLDDVVKKILNKANPWKWNQTVAPVFYTQPFQQDYPTQISQSVLGWIEACTMIDINNLTSEPPVQPPVKAVARLQPTSKCGYPTKISWVINSSAITGSWPGSGIPYISPLVSQGGGPNSNPLTAITDPNGNIQVVTTYGVTGPGPTWPAALSSPGTITNDGTVQWTLIDPNGIAWRLDSLATFNSNVWQMNPVYQNKPPNITSLKQTISPIPDDLSYLVKQGFLAYCRKQVDDKMFQSEFMQWMQDVQEALGASDREDQEYGFAPSQGLANPGMGGGTGSYGFPGWIGWTSDGY